MTPVALRATALALGTLLLAGCAARLPVRPIGTPRSHPAALVLYGGATSWCDGLRTFTGELRLSGRAGRERVRARLIAGFAAPASLRLEAVAPFGPPGFVLAGRDNRATLIFPRERQVLDDEAVPDLLDALAGLALGAGDLRRIISGCVGDEPASDGLDHGSGWTSVSVGEGRRAYLRAREGRTVLVAADYEDWQIDYSAHLHGIPRHVRVRRAATGLDLSAEIASVEMNVDVPDEAFRVEAPPNADRITLRDLRAASPLHAREP
jgi:outer membrane biogenesis lipoprotein LolB